MTVLFVILDPEIVRNLKKLRAKVEKVAEYCRKKNVALELIIVMDALRDHSMMNEFRMERLIKWVSWIYQIPIKARVINSAVPLLTAAEEIMSHDYEKIFYTPETGHLKRALPRSMRLQLEDFIGTLNRKLEVA